MKSLTLATWLVLAALLAALGCPAATTPVKKSDRFFSTDRLPPKPG